jgi:hypothetical protein
MSKPIKTKKIKLADLKPGDKIKSYCTTTHNVVFSNVLDVWDTLVPKEEQVRINFDDGSHLECSTLHPIMVNVKGSTIQKMPEDLTHSDQVISTNGIVYMTSVSKGGSRDPRYMDISVDGSNFFFAQAPDTHNMILVHNCNQGGVRGGAATCYFPFWHLQFEDLVVLKNNKGTEDNRARHMDYGVQFNKLAYERLLSGANLTLFSPSDVPGLYDAFFEDQNKFRDLYEKYERDPHIRKKTIKSTDLFTTFMNERKNTGRIYLMNVDHCNTHGSYIEHLAPIRQSNLCLTGDTELKLLHTDGKEQTVSLDSFVERWQYGGMNNVKVRSYNTDTAQFVWADVSAAAKTATVTELMEIEDENSNLIRCTPDHQIWTQNRGWVMAKDLVETDVLCAEI